MGDFNEDLYSESTVRNVLIENDFKIYDKEIVVKEMNK